MTSSLGWIKEPLYREDREVFDPSKQRQETSLSKNNRQKRGVLILCGWCRCEFYVAPCEARYRKHCSRACAMEAGAYAAGNRRGKKTKRSEPWRERRAEYLQTGGWNIDPTLLKRLL